MATTTVVAHDGASLTDCALRNPAFCDRVGVRLNILPAPIASLPVLDSYHSIVLGGKATLSGDHEGKRAASVATAGERNEPFAGMRDDPSDAQPSGPKGRSIGTRRR